MVVQYPHTLNASSVGETVKDANGNWITPPDNEEVSGIKCRVESSSSNGYLTGANGDRIDFSWIVYMPLMIEGLQIGSKVEIYDNGTLICTDTVKRFSKGQMNCRAWL